MRDPHKHEPDDLDQRVNRYVEMAAGLEIELGRVVKYARILIAAQEVIACNEKLEEEAKAQAAIFAAAEHGVYEEDAARARKAYANARKAQQAVHASAQGVASKLVRLEQLLAARHKLLPVDVAAEFPLERISASANVIKAFASATAPSPTNLADFKMAKSELSLTTAGHTLQWWNFCMPRHRGRWAEMHSLARAWRLTDAIDLDSFKRRVRKLRPIQAGGRSFIAGCPPWARP